MQIVFLNKLIYAELRSSRFTTKSSVKKTVWILTLGLVLLLVDLKSLLIHVKFIHLNGCWHPDG